MNITVPQFIQASLPRVMMISAKVGDSIELDCSSDSYPHPEALWYKYNIPLLDITYRKLEETLKFRKLVLNNLLLADAGNYSCQANGTLGSIIYRTFILYVYGEYGAVMNFFSHTMPLSLSCGRCIGPMVSALDCRSRGPFPNPCQGHCVVFFNGRYIYFTQLQPLSPCRCINGY